ncbi:MAG: CDP-alcohol phosphatidyltransferase family protein [Candidatus Omnitrophica bacterium]|nr:CDP-alcohol phosphatidyltransferase family protein [Candidatus Omnitrophota bacterium]
MNEMNLANRITMSRIILIPFFIGAVIYSKMEIALVFFVLAIITDGVDGLIARTQNQKTKLGTILDPIADKLLLMSAFICLSMVRTIPPALRLPPYVPIIVISRDVIIVLGALVIHIITGDVKISPSILGKVTTFFQMMTIVSVLIYFKYSCVMWNIAVVLTVISGIDYLIRGSRLLNGNNFISKKAE